MSLMENIVNVTTPLLDWFTVCVHETMYQPPPSNYISYLSSLEYSMKFVYWSISPSMAKLHHTSQV